VSNPRTSSRVTHATAPPAPTSALTPYRILAWIMLGCGAMSAVLARSAGVSDDLRRLDIAVAVVFVLLAGLSAFAAPRVPGGWGLDALIVFVAVMGCRGAAVVPSGEAQVLTGLGLSLFAVFAGYFRPRPRFAGILAVILLGYALAALANPVLTSSAEIVAVIGVIAGVSIMVNSQAARLQRLVLHDPLTGALNRRGLEFHVPQVAATAARANSPVTVGLIDLDDFKGYNDVNGHLAGDEVLKRVADAWIAAIRQSDLVVRYGGDEFALVLVGTSPADAEQLAARVQDTDPYSWSVGFSEWQPEEDIYDALRRADAAMFDAKPDAETP
jgi:diguanylate cyclase (GGDEF)-like protein